MPEITARLSTALADRYRIEQHLGEGGMATGTRRGGAMTLPLFQNAWLRWGGILCSVASTACGGSDPVDPGPDITVTSVEVRVAGYPYIGLGPAGVEGWVGRSILLVAIPHGPGTENMTVTNVRWTSDNPDVATIGSPESRAFGQLAALTGVSIGRATVFAEIEGVTGSYQTVVHSGYKPVPVDGGLVFASLTAGRHTCGLTLSGVAYCWGPNEVGQLGVGDTGNRGAPTLVAGDLSFTGLSAGSHTCGTTTSGDAYCWGLNTRGQLGSTIQLGSTTEGSAVPVMVGGGIDFATVDAGTETSCGLTSSGEAYCWGWNFRGMLGNPGVGELESSPEPVPVSGGLTFSSITVGNAQVCAVGVDGVGYCWGSGNQLGNGTSTNRMEPTPVSGEIRFRSLSAGSFYTCGVSVDGTGFCWGQGGDGQLGDGTRTEVSLNPVRVSGGLQFFSITLIGSHACGVTSTGAYCWGEGRDGQLSGGYEPSLEPRQVVGVEVEQIDAGGTHSCGLTRDGRAYCWGRGSDGQLGKIPS